MLLELESPQQIDAFDKRENVSGAYLRIKVQVATTTPTQPTTPTFPSSLPSSVWAWTYVADPKADNYAVGLSSEKAFQFLLTGTGQKGTSLDYAKSVFQCLQKTGIEDPTISKLIENLLSQ
eukprot:Lithocolla_globosa_v1_NODE_5532_length_1224_cov_2.630453.p1 type:complete len:121 gc:universal NODE_5532_length_1224_cov_2.630453:373-735(+)